MKNTTMKNLKQTEIPMMSEPNLHLSYPIFDRRNDTYKTLRFFIFDDKEKNQTKKYIDDLENPYSEDNFKKEVDRQSYYLTELYRYLKSFFQNESRCFDDQSLSPKEEYERDQLSSYRLVKILEPYLNFLIREVPSVKLKSTLNVVDMYRLFNKISNDRFHNTDPLIEFSTHTPFRNYKEEVWKC